MAWDTLHGKYPNFRRYFRAFVDLPFPQSLAVKTSLPVSPSCVS